MVQKLTRESQNREFAGGFLASSGTVQPMSAEPEPAPILAPLQRVMLRDSLAWEGSGNHVEQLEITFSMELGRARVAAAWAETVAASVALRMAFICESGQAVGWEIARNGGDFREEGALPESWLEWREIDRRRAILAPGTAPWRVAWWPAARKFIWTFHHALLDGRSITRVVQNFLTCLGGGVAVPLALAKWHPPTPAAVALAEGIFRKSFAGLERTGSPMATELGGAKRVLGRELAQALETAATAMDSTPAAALIWAWGQALAASAGADAVLVEQVRAGPPQPGTAGFTMNTLPVLIHRAAAGTEEISLRDFRRELLALRAIEQVSPGDFAPGVFPDLSGSSVIMVERGDLRQQVGAAACENFVASLRLHEPPSLVLTASARLLPDLQLVVEGPGRQALLDAWVRLIRRLAR